METTCVVPTLSGKTILVTGAAQGMGEQHARTMARLGANVILTDIQVDKGKAIVADIGSNAIFIEHDVADAQAWEKAIREASDRFGRLHGLVNNAAIAYGTPFEELTVEHFNRFISVNTAGVLLGMQAAAAKMKSTGGGSIVNISSVAGLYGSKGAAAYIASKFAVTGLTKAAALDLAEFGIRVNSVHPGTVDTPQQAATKDMNLELYKRLPFHRMAKSEEVSGMVAFLMSDSSSYCTGAEFVIDGGLSCMY